jgi:hypothetical protein
MFIFVLWVCRKAFGNVSCIQIYLRNRVISSQLHTVSFQELSISFGALFNLLISFPPLSSVNMDE